MKNAKNTTKTIAPKKAATKKETVTGTTKTGEDAGKPATPANVKATPKAKTPKEPNTDLVITVYSKGVVHFGKLAAVRIADNGFIAIETKGKMITLTPTTDETAAKVTPGPQIGASKLLKASGWNGQTQKLVAEPVGKSGLQFEIA